MGQISVKFDHNLKQSEIIMPLVNSSEKEAGKSYVDNKTGIQQTHVYGIQCPLISINGIIIDFNDVIDFSLKCKDILPTVSITVRDKYELIGSFNELGSDNEVRIQILPQFDNAYKKINLTFYINKIRTYDNYIQLSGLYKVSDLVSTRFKAFGQLNSYDLFYKIAEETKLGFATNVESNDQDKRYIYCDYKSYKELLEKEINYGGSQTDIYDWWIDWWNNITLVNIYERYNTIDKDDDMKIWVSSQTYEVGEGIDIIPRQVIATLNNHPVYRNSELYVNNYEIINNTGKQFREGSDHVYSIYENNKEEHMDHLIQDGDVKEDIFTKFEYLGEVCGDYNYLLQNKLRNSFLQKIKSESLEITTNTPLLGLMRGNKINFVWYVNNDLISDKMQYLEENDIIYNDPSTNIPLDDKPDIKVNEDNGSFKIDRAISGQYLITGCNIKFNNNQWSYTLTLNRPADQKSTFFINE